MSPQALLFVFNFPLFCPRLWLVWDPGEFNQRPVENRSKRHHGREQQCWV